MKATTAVSLVFVMVKTLDLWNGNWTETNLSAHISARIQWENAWKSLQSHIGIMSLNVKVPTLGILNNCMPKRSAAKSETASNFMYKVEGRTSMLDTVMKARTLPGRPNAKDMQKIVSIWISNASQTVSIWCTSSNVGQGQDLSEK